MNLCNIADAFPAVFCEPMNGSWTAAFGVPRRFCAAFEEVLGAEPVYYGVKSKTWVDVGSWWSKAPIWVVASTRLYLLSCGLFWLTPRPFVVKIEYKDVIHSIYAHERGNVILKMTDSLYSLRVDPIAGYQILAQIQKGKEQNA